MNLEHIRKKIKDKHARLYPDRYSGKSDPVKIENTFAVLCSRSLHAASLFTYDPETQKREASEMTDALQGVYVEISARSVLYAATDGLVLFATRHALKTDDNTFTENLIVPREHCKCDLEILFDLPVTEYPTTTLIPYEDGTVSRCAFDRVVFRPIKAAYPDWRKLFDATGVTPNFSPQAIDWSLMKLFTDAFKINPKLGYPILYPAAPGKPVAVRYDGTAAGVIMPLRANLPSLLFPAWIDES
jgi:hypothetical protein